MACVWRRSCLATAGGGGTVRAVRAVRASRASKGGPTPTWPLSAKPTSAADEVHGRRIAQLQSPSPPATVVDVAAPLSPTPATPLPPSPLPPSPLLIILLLFDIFFSFRVESSSFFFRTCHSVAPPQTLPELQHFRCCHFLISFSLFEFISSV